MKTKLLIFGITGDLSRRKLLPALISIRRAGELPDLQIIGVSRRKVTAGAVLSGTSGADELEPMTSVFTMNLEDRNDYDKLKDFIDLQEDEQLLAYLSVPPAAAGAIIRFMGEAGLNTPNVKLLLEKPFGVDLESAREMVERIERHYHEEQVYRIDHYLAKEMAQNVVVFRARNAIFGHLWNNEAIEKIEIDALEEIGVGTRAQFYEQTGALRDVVQSHLLQLLALVLMDAPEDLDWRKVPARRLTALKQITPAEPSRTVRAQYAGYQDEAGNPGSQTETFARLELFSDAPQWQDVPLVLTHGKALDKKLTEIRVFFKKTYNEQSNCLVFRVQPKEEIEIDLFVKQAGYERKLVETDFRFVYPQDAHLPEAYEQVLLDAAEGRKSLFPSSAEVCESWRIVQPLLEAWGFSSAPLSQYAKGSNLSAVLGGVESTTSP
jgi:glucose-6-phosphate 1-dehydrogenase